MSHIESLLKSRVSTNLYDADRTLDDAQIEDLIALATTAPSAFNLQNWKFIAVRSPQGKAKLKPLTYGQQKVADAAVTFIVCGTLEPHLTLPAALKAAVDAGILDRSIHDGWVNAATSMYGNNTALQRDEAVRSASLAAMTLMLVAQDRGLSSGPMIGFDPAGVASAFGLQRTDVPVMLVTVGHALPGNWPQKPRKATSDVLSFA